MQSTPEHHRTSRIPRRKHYGVGRKGYRTDLHNLKLGSVTAVRYQHGVLEPFVRFYAAAVGLTFVLMGDNALLHRAAIVDDYLKYEVIQRMAWPAYLPEFNPIENLWDALLYLHVSYLQPLLFSLKLPYKKNGDCLILRWLTT